MNPRLYPLLDDAKYGITSPPDRRYNCVAWALNITSDLWWPDEDHVWFDNVPRSDDLPTFVLGFESVGYEVCDSGGHDVGWEKVAIYARATGTPTHVARQLSDGRWTSKLGIEDEDIWHETAEALGMSQYGSVRVFMKRRAVSGIEGPRAGAQGPTQT